MPNSISNGRRGECVVSVRLLGIITLEEAQYGVYRKMEAARGTPREDGSRALLKMNKREKISKAVSSTVSTERKNETCGCKEIRSAKRLANHFYQRATSFAEGSLKNIN